MMHKGVRSVISIDQPNENTGHSRFDQIYKTASEPGEVCIGIKFDKLIKKSCVALSLACVLGASLSYASKSNNKNVDAKKEVAFLVDASIAKSEVVPETLTAVGHLEAYRNVSLSFNTSGLIKKLYYKDGQQVKQGTLIATLDDSVDQSNVAVAQATLLGSKSIYESNLELSKQMAVAKVTLVQAKSKWLQDKATLELQRRTLDLKKLYAPFDGYLGVFNVKEGAYVDKGNKVIALRQISPVRVDYSLPSTDQSLVELAQSVEINSNALPDQKFEGLVSYRAQYIDQSTGTLAIEATVKNPNFVLLPGMFVQVTQIIDPNRKLLVIPSIALQTDIGGEFVYLVKDKHLVGDKLYATVSQRKIKSKLVAGNLTAVEKGIKDGDWIIASGQQKLHDGAAIIIANGKKLHDSLLAKSSAKASK
jgi:RND family efflux transporter MFP subunit